MIRAVRSRSVAWLLGLALLAVACGPAGSTSPSAAGGTPTNVSPTVQADLWRSAELRDVRSGDSVRISDLAGKVVVIEPMAIWCFNCRAQQNEAREALSRLNRSDLVYISVDVDSNETEADLARYADDRGYPWHFIVASREVARSLAETFGDQVLSPPSTPKIVVAVDGHAEVSFGFRGAAQLEAELAAKLP